MPIGPSLPSHSHWPVFFNWMVVLLKGTLDILHPHPFCIFRCSISTSSAAPAFTTSSRGVKLSPFDMSCPAALVRGLPRCVLVAFPCYRRRAPFVSGFDCCSGHLACAVAHFHTILIIGGRSMRGGHVYHKKGLPWQCCGIFFMCMRSCTM
jgi:hypothetical protein